MTDIALFHSVLGVRPGVLDAADRMRAAGHTVHVPDLFDGRVFDDYDEAIAFAQSIGFDALHAAAVRAVADVPDGFVSAGFSAGADNAERVALSRTVSGVLLFGGGMPIEYLDATAWPAGVPVQLHFTVHDPWRDEGSPESILASARAAGAPAELFEYPGSGHLFTDASMTDEYDAASAELLWERVLAFLEGVGQ